MVYSTSGSLLIDLDLYYTYIHSQMYNILQIYNYIYSHRMYIAQHVQYVT